MRALALAAALAILAGPAFAQAPAETPQQKAAAKAAAALKQFPPPGRLVDIGGRRLHVLCKGPAKGDPTVILEVGAVASSLYYWKAQDQIAKVARTCVYDRAGQGWSDPPAAYPRSLEDRADDLHALLVKGRIKGPYILVAHSAGGLIARIYAKKYPKGLAGLVLMESSEEGFNGSPDNVARTAATAKLIGQAVTAAANDIDIPQLRVPGAPPEEAAVLKASVFRAGQDDMEAMSKLPQEMARLGGLGSLGDLPLVVVSRGKRDPGTPAAMDASWAEAHARLAKLSTRSVAMVAERSGHNVHADQPEVYAEALRRVIALGKQKP